MKKQDWNDIQFKINGRIIEGVTAIEYPFPIENQLSNFEIRDNIKTEKK